MSPPNEMGQDCIPSYQNRRHVTIQADLHVNVRILMSVTKITLTLLC